MIDLNKMKELAYSLREEYANNQPFPHIVIDNFLPDKVAEAVLQQFPVPEKMDGKTYQKAENKIAARPDTIDFPEYLKDVLYALNSHEVITFLEILSGINGLVADPNFLGAGLHQTMRGGRLGIHADFNYHKHLRLNRRMNLIIYFNKNWEDEYGGHLELWDKEMSACRKKVAPIFNRCVIFNTTDTSYHGHPDPLNCPDSLTRKSIALYYYTSGRPEDDSKEIFWTAHQKRPNTPDYIFEEMDQESLVRKIIRNLSPPIIIKIIQKLKNF